MNMAPNLISNERVGPTDVTGCFSSEDDTATLSNNNSESTDKTHNTNSQCSSMSDAENYECYGEGEMDTSGLQNQSGELLGDMDLKRNTWLRTSLRRSPTSRRSETLPNRKWGSFRTSGKRIGSNALASQLYRSSSFNSSGRSSATCDTATDDVYSDVSLEEDVLDLNHKVQMLQQQMNVLADNQTNSDERYTRTKQENAALQARILMLEEQLREVELRSEERLAEEERRRRELVARVDREKQLQVENCAIRLQTSELTNSNLKEELFKLKSEYETQIREKTALEERFEESQNAVHSLKEEIQLLKDQEKRYKEEHTTMQQIIEELNREVEVLKSEKQFALAELQDCKETPSQIETELHANLDALRLEHKNLQEAYEELQALLLSRNVEEGRTLLTGSNSLAAELEEMTNDDYEENITIQDNQKIKTALKEQQEVNAQLRKYIDNILLNIVENYPQLLEVKGTNI